MEDVRAEVEIIFMEAKDEMMSQEEWDRLDVIENKVLAAIKDK